ncbi:MAG: CoA transferase, partial [Deltaproteobacteria bacterium]|nr:CoA transferase [Deltaproteobacteria bacterium]
PRLGEHGGQIEAHKPKRPRSRGASRLPLEGMRIIDTTSWWAGPIATHMMAMLGAEAAPQGLYPCSGHHVSENPQWLALSVASETQWEALLGWLGRPDWATEVGADLSSRRSQQDQLDEALRRVFAGRKRDACVEELLAAGVPAAPVLGQHNAEILRELGHNDDEIVALAAQKVIGDRPEGV